MEDNPIPLSERDADGTEQPVDALASAGPSSSAIARRAFLKGTGVAVLGGVGGAMALSGRAEAIPRWGAYINLTQHEEDTISAICDAAVPGPSWWGQTSDPEGTPGALQSGALDVMTDPYYGIAPHLEYITADIDNWCYWNWAWKNWNTPYLYKELPQPDREYILQQCTIHGGYDYLAYAYRGIVALTKFCFMGGLINTVGTDYIGFPGPNNGYPLGA